MDDCKKTTILRAWSKDLVMKRMDLQKIPIWVSLPGLPFHYWSTESLSAIGSVLGKPLYTDRYTKSRERLSYTRICIEVDASEPLQDSIIIEKEDGGEFIQKVLFDWKPLRLM